MKVGCTATRYGLTDAQLSWFTGWAKLHRTEIDLFIDGGCVGGDMQLCSVFSNLGIRTRERPCTIETARAYFPHDEVMEAKAPLLRNDDIVADADVMLCGPREMAEVLRSGTWAAIRSARRAYLNTDKYGWLVLPDGTRKLLSEWTPRGRITR